MNNRKTKEDVRAILTKIGISSYYFGYHYLVSAICLAIEDPKYRTRITNKLYPEVGKAYNIKANAVKEGIHRAIEMWDKNNEYALTFSQNIQKETPKQFIVVLTDYFINHRYYLN